MKENIFHRELPNGDFEVTSTLPELVGVRGVGLDLKDASDDFVKQVRAKGYCNVVVVAADEPADNLVKATAVAMHTGE
jgi:hypothetical protein